MGTIKKGILGGFSGKVGTVVGGSWKGIAYMRSLAQSVKNPRTSKQTVHRAKFVTLVDLLKQFSDFLGMSFKEYAHKMSGFNAATQLNFRNEVVGGTAPNFTIDFSKLAVAHGSLTGVATATAAYASDNLTISWDDNTGEDAAMGTDNVLAVFINTTTNKTIAKALTNATRADESYVQAIPATWKGNSVACYLAFQKGDGSAVSDSLYVNTVAIPAA